MGVIFPGDESQWYRIRVLQPGESRRVFGTTTVFVDAHSGEVLGEFNALTATPFAPRVLAPLYEDLFRDSDPEVRRLACREMTTWMLLSHPPNEQALNTLLGDPLLAEQASETLSRCQRPVRSRN